MKRFVIVPVERYQVDDVPTLNKRLCEPQNSIL